MLHTVQFITKIGDIENYCGSRESS